MPEDTLTRIAAGDAKAVDDCLSTYRGLVWSIARRLCSDLDEAEDAVQEIFVDVWRNAGRFNPQVGSEATFISTIARRRLIDRRRKVSRRPSEASLEQHPATEHVEHEHLLETAEEVARVRLRMDELRPEERMVLELSISHGLSQREIAQQTQLPLGTVKTHARRGMIRLRELLGVASGQEGDGAPVA